MGKESDHVQMLALSQCLRVTLVVEYLDRSSPRLVQHRFEPDPLEQTSASTCATSSQNSHPPAAPAAPPASRTTSASVEDGAPLPKSTATCDPPPAPELSEIVLLYRPGHFDILYQK